MLIIDQSIGIIITKPPETVCVILPPQDIISYESIDTYAL